MQYSLHCHCNTVRLELTLSESLDTYTPRKCDCDFCEARNLAYLSDPNGLLKIQTQVPLNTLKQGSEQATFLQCSQCEQVVAVIAELGHSLKGAISVELFNSRFQLAQSQAASPKLLSAEQKRERWAALWLTVEIEDIDWTEAK